MRGIHTEFPASHLYLRLFFAFFEQDRKAMRSCCPWAMRYMSEPPPRARGEKGLPLRAELAGKGGGHGKVGFKSAGSSVFHVLNWFTPSEGAKSILYKWSPQRALLCAPAGWIGI